MHPAARLASTRPDLLAVTIVALVAMRERRRT